MNSDEARRVAERAKPSHDVPDGAQVTSVERRYIEIAGASAEVAAPVRDVLAWVVRFQRGIAWVDLAVDDATREVVRVQRSRAQSQVTRVG